ncbi:Arginine/ornithine antiporter [Dermatophilus congolensis]|uniref:Arginine-ornithine antiporter n=1 Tax=Dermatophilus congolensis TaxID=1863 RepID=A0AA46GZV3_9MICO|nr:arginine-ornithine antiporter [Dermatophilus congolensis]STD05833.1 Arginine/ornithine antiporter [Dermatophilus congolensis]
MSTQTDDTNNTEPTSIKPGTISVTALTALVIGSMIGGGIFSLPSQMASAAAPGPLIIGWIITGFGMLMLAMVFQRLAISRPEIDAGVYGYAKAGFGNYTGFSSAWGYWLSAWMGNVGYMVLLMSALGVFFPGFGDGNTPQAIAVASILVWVYHFLLLRGMREAAFINLVVTIAKILPLLVFIIIAVISFDAGIFSADFWGTADTNLGSTLDQVKSMMLVTVWVFIGVEGASIFSERARTRADVGKATIIGFVSVLALLLFVNILSYGIVPRAELANLANPSLGGVLTAAVGPWGAKIIAFGLAISLIGALLSWSLMCAEILRAPALDNTFPAWFGKANNNGTPAGAMWLTSICVQLMLIWTLFNSSTYTQLVVLASALILLPYLFSAAFQLLEAFRAKESRSTAAILVGFLGTIYAFWLLYAAGLTYLLYVGLFYLIGTPFYVVARKKSGLKVFDKIDTIVFLFFLFTSIYAIWGLSTGHLSL